MNWNRSEKKEERKHCRFTADIYWASVCCLKMTLQRVKPSDTSYITAACKLRNKHP